MLQYLQTVYSFTKISILCLTFFLKYVIQLQVEKLCLKMRFSGKLHNKHKLYHHFEQINILKKLYVPTHTKKKNK